MDKDRIAGSVKQVKGPIKEAIGKAVGDVKLQSEGESEHWKAISRMPSAGSRTRSETP